ncbi:acryloyl-CoA reductase [Paenibacillus sediminis]|uniref:YhdH/YhfP family quinone oxidoreductase n=1 Tax=Paenibacillus sediminis TaxID=664909 RepID=A0ABS4H0N6_9BACL|nr:acryloyl-CoA reductase [Paenibacillus sediminis]MBP1935680.1 putative YhdH/YhfP family quinone oxidoreductase [Paenibacillus sediminis]
MDKFKALVIDGTRSEVTRAVKELTLDDLPEGDVTIQVFYSSVNYKDGLASIANSTIVKTYPHVPGIDLAGRVLSSADKRFKEGDEVLVTGYNLGTSHFGGYSQVARVPADWVVRIPEGLSMKEAMAIGTAGFTAALSIYRMEQNGVRPNQGPVLVTGAKGGVGSTSIAMLSKLGYEVVASTRQSGEHEFLKQLGAHSVISPEELQLPENKRLLSEKWAAAVDPVAGKYLSYILATIKYGGSVAVSGFTGGADFSATVYPFILRGVNLLGIDSVFCPMDIRTILWDRIANELKPAMLIDSIGYETTLENLPAALDQILKGEIRGRAVVSLQN